MYLSRKNYFYHLLKLQIQRRKLSEIKTFKIENSVIFLIITLNRFKCFCSDWILQLEGHFNSRLHTYSPSKHKFFSVNIPFFKVRIEQARLQSFLAVAEELGIKGLAEENKQTEDSQTEPEPEPEPEPEHQEVECSGNDPESMTTTEKNSDFTLTSENASLEQKSEVVK